MKRTRTSTGEGSASEKVRYRHTKSVIYNLLMQVNRVMLRFARVLQTTAIVLHLTGLTLFHNLW